MKHFVLLFLGLALSLSTSAKQVDGLYKAKILVPNQSQQSHLNGAKAGLMEVLHKVTGYEAPIEHRVHGNNVSPLKIHMHAVLFRCSKKRNWVVIGKRIVVHGSLGRMR